MTKTKWNLIQKTMTKTKNQRIAAKINTRTHSYKPGTTALPIAVVTASVTVEFILNIILKVQKFKGSQGCRLSRSKARGADRDRSNKISILIS